MKRNLGIKQSEDYNGYQREYHRIYYKEKYTDWKDYLLRRRYREMDLWKLHEMLEHKLSAKCTMPPEKKDRLIKILREIISEKEYFDYKPKDEIIDIRNELENLNREIHNKGL